MRERLRGFALGVQFVASTEGVTGLGRELVEIVNVVAGNSELHDVIADIAVEINLKKVVISQLFGSKVSEYGLRIFNEIIQTEEPGKIYEVVWALEKVLAAPLELSTSSLTTTSRVRAFAYALLSSIEDTSRLTWIEEQLFVFRNVVESAPRLRRALSGIGTEAEQRIAIVNDLMHDMSDKFFVEIVRFAASSGRIRDYVEVLDLIGEIAARLRETKIAKVHVVKPLTVEQIEQVANALEIACGAVVEIREIIDESVIGGVLAIVGDTIFDGSVKHTLDQLRSRLTTVTSAR